MKQKPYFPDPIPFSKEGLEKVHKQFEEYTARRKIAIKNLQTARAMGDLSENAAYKVARLELGHVDRTLRNLKFQIRFGYVKDAPEHDVVDFGSTVTISKDGTEKTFSIVGNFEADPKNGKLSTKSPMGRAVLGKKIGETVSVITPHGATDYTIVTIKN